MSNKTNPTESGRKGVHDALLSEYVEQLSRLIECRTVFTPEGKYKDEFDKFYNTVDELFPNLKKRAKRMSFGGGAFVYLIEGKNAERNVMLMSHHDVVDSDPTWGDSAFLPTVSEGCLFGRGTVDTKTPLFAILRAVEELLAEGYGFDGINLYVASSNNEEVSGDGMVLIADYFREKGIRFDTVLDEGGAITEGQIPGVGCKSAVVAVHEKSRHLFRVTAEHNPSGHGGFGAPSEGAVERLSRFISEITENKKRIFKGRFYPEVRATFERHITKMSFPMNLLFGNMSVFSPIIKKIMMGIPAASAMLSTSVSFTYLSAVNEKSKAIRPENAEAFMVLRCVREETLQKELEIINRIAAKNGVSVSLEDRDYCKPTDFNGEAFARVEGLLKSNFPDVAVAPFLLTAGTDARRLTDVADNILRFAPIDLDKKRFATIHSSGENIGTVNVGECVVFYKDYIKSFKGEQK